MGSGAGGIRPVLVIQNDVGNKYSPTVIVAAITQPIHQGSHSTHVCVRRMRGGLKQDSTVLAEQIRTIDRNRLKEYIGHLDSGQMAGIEQAMVTSLGLGASDRQYGTGLSAVLFMRRRYRLRHKEIIMTGPFSAYIVMRQGTACYVWTVRWDRKVKMILTYVINCPIIIDISQKQSETAEKEKAYGATVQSQKNLFRASHRHLLVL